jgi:hypothetical protein
MKEVLEAPPTETEHPSAPSFSLSTVWAITAVLLPVVASLEASLSSIDLTYHIRAGISMLDTHALIRTDTYTFTAAGKPWLDQQWLGQVLFAAVRRAGGWPALHLLRAAMVGAIFLFVLLACRAAGTTKKTAAGLTLGSFLVSIGGLGLRPQLIGMLLFSITIYLLFQRDRSPRLLWLVPVVVVIWANTHGSFFLGPLLVALAYLDDVRKRSPGRGRTLGVAAVSVAAVTLNPFGLRVWSYAASLSTNPVITKLVTEWQPPELRDVSGAIFFISAIAVAWFIARRGKATSWSTLLSLGVFFVIGLVAIRGIFWWALVAPVLVAQMLGEERPPAARPEYAGRRGANIAIVGLLAVLAISALPWWRSSNPLATSAELVADAPTGVTARLQRFLSPGDRIFNAQRWGSWFEFALPNNPVAVDSRIEVIPRSVWTAYGDVSFGRQGWQQLLDRWGVSVVVANREQQRELIPLLRNDPGWRLVYQDRAGLVFVRA